MHSVLFDETWPLVQLEHAPLLKYWFDEHCEQVPEILKYPEEHWQVLFTTTWFCWQVIGTEHDPFAKGFVHTQA